MTTPGANLLLSIHTLNLNHIELVVRENGGGRDGAFSAYLAELLAGQLIFILLLMLAVVTVAGLLMWLRRRRHSASMQRRAFTKMARVAALPRRQRQQVRRLAGKAGVAPVALLLSPSLRKHAAQLAANGRRGGLP